MASMKPITLSIVLAMTVIQAGAAKAPDILIADFEGKDYGAWKITGDAFGPGPAKGGFPNQMRVDGYLGKGMVNSFFNGDRTTGTLTSPPFKIERKFIRFLIGGGGWTNQTCIKLLIADKEVRSATGPNLKPGGSEHLDWQNLDVGEFADKTAVIQIVDNAKGGWGHINVDHILQTDVPVPTLATNVSREMNAEKPWLHFPVQTGAPKRKIEILVDGKQERFFDIELADEDAQWWAPLDIREWKGKQIKIVADKLPEDSKALAMVEQTTEFKNAADLYLEPLRPQFHFSPKRGWNNDPNGLSFYRGEYHLFFQHNPYGWAWGNMHWGHAVSKDLVHWQEVGEALYPDEMGPMYSGSAVVDEKNTSGFGKAEQAPLVLIYTAAGHPTVQGIAHSTDGRTFTKFNGNPVIKEISGGNRDPKVFWHQPSGKWIMTLYVGFPDPEKKDAKGKPARKDFIYFFSSPNLKEWTEISKTEGFFECPDFFELPVDGQANHRKWVLTAASSDYMVGTFDGTKFNPETAKLKGHLGRGFYAAQTFSDIPAQDGRRIQIGWFQAPSPGMPFNQAMTIPLELKLVSTPEGPRLTWTPVTELTTLRSSSKARKPFTLKSDSPLSLADMSAELLEFRTVFEPGEAEVTFNVRGATITYDAKKQEIVVNGHKSPAPLLNRTQTLIIYCDRTALEIFASNGRTYVPMPHLAKPENLSLDVSAKGGDVKFTSLETHALKSAWEN
jgi:sucrose-6-phosphate hydrolase SacC (GH32 family)